MFNRNMREASFYQKVESGAVRCLLCRHECLIQDGYFGLCRMRENRGGILFTETYGIVSACAADPVEKKPLFHFLPGTDTFSLATFGCNFRCSFCQNADISQISAGLLGTGNLRKFSPGDIIAMAEQHGCSSISYTYNEPTLFCEFALEAAELALEKGFLNVFVTNGYMSDGVIERLQGVIHAYNIDLKFFSETSYRNLCGASLQGVLRSIEFLKQHGSWIEITTLLIPGYNDSREELTKIAQFIASVDKNIPWHISRFFPAHKFLMVQPTAYESLHLAYTIGKEVGLCFIYLGNVPGQGSDNTFCPVCGTRVIKRRGFSVLENLLKEGSCPSCGNALPGIWVKR